MLLRSLFLASLLFFLSTISFAQSFPVFGKVTNPLGEPLAGVTVQVKGGKGTTTTKPDGTFQVSAPSGNAVLVLSYVGFTEQQVSVNNKSSLTVSMAPSTAALENVVVIGYGTQKKRDITAAVATYNANDITDRPVARIDQALVGQMAGVQVKQTTGAPGKAFSIQVRGSGSITAGSEPLYVLDGFPLSSTAPGGSGTYSTGNPLDNINPNDIESIQVLKDAAAAAIYGSRAANGVVLITTKRGQSGKPKLNLNTYVGFTERSRKLDMLNADEWIDRSVEMINAAWVASGAGRTATQTTEERRQILGLAPGIVNTAFMIDDRWLQPGHPGLNFIDWQDVSFRKGLVQNHQLSASGGNEFVKYYVSGNYGRQEGMVIGMDYTAYSGRANVEITPNKRMKFGINITPTYSITNDPGVEGKDNILHHMVSYTPVQEDTMGLTPNIGNNGQYRWALSFNSPLERLKSGIGQTKRFRTLSTVFGEYEITKGLTFRTTANLDNTDNNTKTYIPYTITNNLATRLAQTTALTSGTYNSFRRQTFVNENTLSFNTVIKDDHSLSLLAGFAYNTEKLDRASLSSQNGFNSGVITTLNAANAVTGNTTETKNVLLSYFGRAQYSFNGKYLLSASFRRDGASRFGVNTKWGIFPSASIGWRVSEEKFMSGITQISDLKLRASWGKSGSYNIPDYGSIPVLAAYNYSFGGNTGLPAIGQAPSGVTNPDLTWEKSQTLDFGIDFGVLRNRITASFDYYIKDNTSLLLNVPIPAGTGFSNLLTNSGAVKNKGWELELTSRNMTGAFTWSTTANFSHNTNKVVGLAGGQSQILVPSLFDVSHTILRVGQPINSIYVVKMIGILTQDDINKKVPMFGNQSVGDPKYFDADGNGIIDPNDRVIVGNPNPKYTWGVTNSFRYKGFDLSVLVQGQWGGSIYSLLGRAIGRTGQGFVDNALGTYRDRWRSESNPGAGTVSKAYSTFGRIKNTDWLYPSDYIRVRSISLGYDLGKALKAKFVQGARAYVTAENFFGHDKYKGGFNPEASNTDLSGSSIFPEAGDYGGLPLPKSFTFGLNFTF